MDFLAGAAAQPAAAAAARSSAAALDAAPAREPCLLVSGRIRAGEVELDPSYMVETRPTPLEDGEYAVDLLDRGGARVASFPFAPTPASAEEEGAPEEAHFAMALPLSSVAIAAVHALAIRRRGVEVARRTSASAPGAVSVEVGAAPGRAVLRWDHALHPEVMVRDPRTGEVLAFARGGTAQIRAEAPEIEIATSDGVHSARPARARAR
jgi:hypothetical protein